MVGFRNNLNCTEDRYSFILARDPIIAGSQAICARKIKLERH